MSEEADMSFLVEESRVLFSISCSIFGRLADIPVQDHRSVQGDFNMIPVGNDLLIVPFPPYRLQIIAPFCSDDAVYRPCTCSGGVMFLYTGLS